MWSKTNLASPDNCSMPRGKIFDDIHYFISHIQIKAFVIKQRYSMIAMCISGYSENVPIQF